MLQFKLQVLKNKIPAHMWVAGSGWISRIVNAGVQIFSIPILFKMLGMEAYAAFSIVTSLVVWFALADFGLGNALQNIVSESRVKNLDIKIILSKIPLLILILLIIEVALLFLISTPVQKFLFKNLNLHDEASVLWGSGILYLTSALFSVAYRILFAYHKGYLAYFYQTLGSLIGFLALLIFYLLKIKICLFTALIMWLLPQTFIAICVFSMLFPIRSFFKIADFKFYSHLLEKSWPFCFVLLAANGVLAVDYIIISHLLLAQDIVTYNTINKIYALIAFGYNSVLFALWPVLSEKYALASSASHAQANKDILRSIAGGVIYIILATVMLIFLKSSILKAFDLAGTINLSNYLILLFCFYYCLRVYVDTYTIALQSRGKLRLFIWVAPLQAIITIPIMILGAKILGLYGIIWALIISFLLTAVWIVPYMHYKTVKADMGV